MPVKIPREGFISPNTEPRTARGAFLKSCVAPPRWVSRPLPLKGARTIHHTHSELRYRYMTMLTRSAFKLKSGDLKTGSTNNCGPPMSNTYSYMVSSSCCSLIDRSSRSPQVFSEVLSCTRRLTARLLGIKPRTYRL